MLLGSGDLDDTADFQSGEAVLQMPPEVLLTAVEEMT